MYRRTALASSVLILAAGCGGTTGGTRARTPPAAGATTIEPEPSRATLPPRPGTTAPSTTPGSAPATPPEVPGGPRLPAAADGTNLRACADGRCEVQVSAHDKIPTPSRLGVDKVTVTSITAHGITLTGTAPGSVLQLSWEGAYGTSYMNGLAITPVAVADGKAVLRIAPK